MITQKVEPRVRTKKWCAEHLKEHREDMKVRQRKWREANPDKVVAKNQEIYRKGGKYYEYMLKYLTTGISGKRHSIRAKHGYMYRLFKQIIAPNSAIHHEWIPGTAEYKGVALVEAEAHRHGIIDVIQILEGKITLLTEAEIVKGRM